MPCSSQLPNVCTKCLSALYKQPNLTKFNKATEDGLRTKTQEGRTQLALSWGLSETSIFTWPGWDLRRITGSLSCPQCSAQGVNWNLSTVMTDTFVPRKRNGLSIYLSSGLFTKAHWVLCVSKNNEGKTIKTAQVKSFAEYQGSRIRAVGSQRSFYFILTLSYMRWSWLGAQD